MDAALAELRSSDSPNISRTAKTHRVDRSSLSRRFNLKTTSKDHGYRSQRLLNPHQEKELIRHIARLCDHCLPPTPHIVANIAHDLCGERPSKNWSSRFVARRRAELDARYLNTLELARHKADTEASYERYFSVMGEKIRRYDISPENMYNMDEKGFLLGKLQKTKRVFTKDLYKHGKVRSSGEDGSREWVTVLATVCADGTSLSPALIYKAASGNLQDTWLEDFRASEHSAYFTSSPNGWTSDELGYSWLTGLFEKESSPKARRSWRLLIVDGHGSHLNLKFLSWCESHKILVAVYRPHSTHRLQPLDVGMFAPLSSYYSQGLDDLVRRSEGHTRLSKRDFFSIFWPAFERAFTNNNIASSWSKTGLVPFDPPKVLKIFGETQDATSGHLEADGRSSNSPGSCFDSPSATRRLRKVVNASVARRPRTDKKTQKTLGKLGDAVLGLSAKLTMVELRNKQFDAALRHERKRRKRAKVLMEEFRASEGSGALFMSPTKIHRARELQMRREREKAQLQHDKERRRQDKAELKVRKAEEAREKRVQR